MEKFLYIHNNFEHFCVPLYIESNKAYWEASLTGNNKDWIHHESVNRKINAFMSDKKLFEAISVVRDSPEITNPIEKRTLDILYLMMKAFQADLKKLNMITNSSSKIEMKFNNFDYVLADGRVLEENKVWGILKNSNDSQECEDVWKASKKIGNVVSEEIRELAKLRNAVARELGYKNYFEMSLIQNEQAPDKLLELFDELDLLTHDNYIKAKEFLDEELAKKFSVSKTELMPWHYGDPFMQECPKIIELDYDRFFTGLHYEEITMEFFKGIGFDLSKIISNSDLYPRENKCRSSYCISIDRAEDIRVLCNNIDNAEWASTSIHEFGHAVYELGINKSLPFVLRDCAHICLTEAVAILFERTVRTPEWLSQMIGITAEDNKEVLENGSKLFALDKLIYSRFIQVVLRFEKALYEDPDQDLNTVWWDLVEKYQHISRPPERDEPDWASKYHIVTSPLYYQNYLLGEVLASQLNHYICNNILETTDYLGMPYIGRKEVGEFLLKKIIEPGKLIHWEELIKEAMGEELTSKYFSEDLHEGLNLLFNGNGSTEADENDNLKNEPHDY